MKNHYDHGKNLTEARRREERRELVICAAGFVLYAITIAGLGVASHGWLRVSAWIGAGLFVVAALWALGKALLSGGSAP